MGRDIIYIRTSDKNHNPENQLPFIRGITGCECEVFKEKQSAWKDDIRARPVFSMINKLIREGVVSSFNVWDLDRIYRNRIKTVEFMALCKHKGVIIRSYRQMWLKEIEKMPSPWNEIIHNFIIQVFGWLAEDESNKKSQRVKASVRRVGGVTLSYKGNKWGRKRVVVDEESVLLLRGEGLSIRNIAKKLKVKRGTIERVLKENKMRNGDLNGK